MLRSPYAPLSTPSAPPHSAPPDIATRLLRTDAHARRRAGWTLAAVLGILGLVAALTAGLLLLTDASDPGQPTSAEIVSPEGQRVRAGDPRSAPGTGDSRAAATASDARPGTNPRHVTAARDDTDFYDTERTGPRPQHGSASMATGDERAAAGIAPTAGPFLSSSSISSSIADRSRDRREPSKGQAAADRPLRAPPLQYQAAVERVRAERAAAEGITPEELIAPLENRGPRTLTRKELAERSQTLLEMRREGLRVTGQLPANADGDS